MTNPDSILKSRDITLQTKVQLVKAMIFQAQNRMWVSGGEGECGVGAGSGLRTRLPEA